MGEALIAEYYPPPPPSSGAEHHAHTHGGAQAYAPYHYHRPHHRAAPPPPPNGVGDFVYARNSSWQRQGASEAASEAEVVADADARATAEGDESAASAPPSPLPAAARALNGTSTANGSISFAYRHNHNQHQEPQRSSSRHSLRSSSGGSSSSRPSSSHSLSAPETPSEEHATGKMLGAAPAPVPPPTYHAQLSATHLQKRPPLSSHVSHSPHAAHVSSTATAPKAAVGPFGLGPNVFIGPALSGYGSVSTSLAYGREQRDWEKERERERTGSSTKGERREGEDEQGRRLQVPRAESAERRPGAPARSSSAKALVDEPEQGLRPTSSTVPEQALALEGEEEEEEEEIEQIVYTSSAFRRDMPSSDIEQILETSRRNNAKDDITGLLLYRDGSFVQFLEGPRSKVQQCYDRIAKDPRHRGLVIIYRKTADQNAEPTGAIGDERRKPEITHRYRKKPQQPSVARKTSEEARSTSPGLSRAPSSPSGRGKRDFHQWSMAFRHVESPAGGPKADLHGWSTAPRRSASSSSASGSGSDGDKSPDESAAGEDKSRQPKSDGPSVVRRSSDPDRSDTITTTVEDDSSGSAAFSALLEAGKIE